MAEVNGRKITLGEYKQMVEAQDSGMRSLAQRQPKQFLEQYALYESVLQAAESAGMDQQSPFKEQLAASRKQVLVRGMIDGFHKNFTVPEEQARKFYEGNKDMYQQAMVRVIFISRGTQTFNLSDKKVTSVTTEDEIKAKVNKASAALRQENADFGKVALEFSDDRDSAAKGGVFPTPISPTSANVPAHIRQPILAAKAGDIVGPIEHESGFYLFKVDSNGEAPFDQVKETIVKQMKDAALQHWLGEFKKKSSVTIQNEAVLTEGAKTK